jgi:hypothetical protein
MLPCQTELQYVRLGAYSQCGEFETMEKLFVGSQSQDSDTVQL